MRALVSSLCMAVVLSGCQLLTNFVRPIVDPVDAGPLEDVGEDAPDAEGDAST